MCRRALAEWGNAMSAAVASRPRWCSRTAAPPGCCASQAVASIARPPRPMQTRSSVAAKAAPADNAASKKRCLSFERGGFADARPSGRRRRSAVQGAASQRQALTKDGAAAPVARRSAAVAYWRMVERTSSGALSRRLSEDLSPRAVFAISAAAAATSSSD